MKKLFPFCMAALISLLLASTVIAQPMAVELEFTSADTINIVAGDSICFRLVAKDSLGNVVTNWSSLGYRVVLSVRNSIAESDTIVKSWSRHADGYTWQRLTVEGNSPTRISPYDYSIDETFFVDGIAHACFTSTAAERNIRLEVGMSAPWASQISPPINVFPAALDNFLVEISCPDASTPTTYVLRPFEIVVTPRDRYLNISNETVKTNFTARFPGEFLTIPGLSDIFLGDVYITGMTNYFVRPAVTRQSPQEVQTVTCFMPDDPTVSGQSDPFEVLPHPPADFSLQLPADQHTLSLTSRADTVTFTWQRPTPPDPYTNMQVSRFDPATYSDTVHYRVHFIDSAMTREVILDANDMGGSAAFTMTHYDLGLLVNHLAGRAVKSAEIIWFVEATDGDFVTASTPVSPTMPGHRLRIDNQLFVNRGIVFDPLSISSTSVPVGNDISVDLYSINMGVRGGVWNSLGEDVTVRVLNTTVDSDTSTRSWSADPEAYSWSRLTAAGQEIIPVAAHEYRIPASLFSNGHLRIRYRSTKAGEDNVRLEFSPVSDGHEQSTPPLHWLADSLDHFLVEVTWHDPAIPGVYVQRPIELIVTPRDRYLNTVDEEVPVSLYAIMSSLETHPELGDTLAFRDPRTLRGQTVIYLQGKDPVDVREGRGEKIYVTNTGQPMVQSSSAEFSIIPHAPLPFELSTPADLATMNLLASHREQTFAWERPEPPDAVTNILVSRLLPLTISDDIRYTFHFRDEYFPQRATSFPSDNDGRDPILTITEGRLAAIIDSFAQDPLAQYRDVLWFVEATDGLYTSRSTDQHPTLRGNRLRLFKESTGTQVHPILPPQVTLAQNYPNPFNPSTTIRYSTTKRANVSLKVYDLLGSEVETIHQGMLDAGEHTVQFDASNLRSGVYVYRLMAEGQTISRRMVVMK